MKIKEISRERVECLGAKERHEASREGKSFAERREIIHRENALSRARTNRVERESLSISRKTWRSVAPRERMNHLESESLFTSREVWRSLAPREGVSLYV